MSLVYLASPYSHADPAVRHARYIAACKAAGELMREGRVVFSPIAHSHPIDAQMSSAGDWEFWKKQDVAILRHCGLLAVLMLDGWRESKGVSWEMAFAHEAQIPVEYIEP